MGCQASLSTEMGLEWQFAGTCWCSARTATSPAAWPLSLSGMPSQPTREASFVTGAASAVWPPSVPGLDRGGGSESGGHVGSYYELLCSGWRGRRGLRGLREVHACDLGDSCLASEVSPFCYTLSVFFPLLNTMSISPCCTSAQPHEHMPLKVLGSTSREVGNANRHHAF